MGKISKYKQQFREEWKLNPLFKNWIKSVIDDNQKACCMYCNVFIQAHYASLTNHAASSKHCKNTAQFEKKPALPESQNSDNDFDEQTNHFVQDKIVSESLVEPCSLELTVDDITKKRGTTFVIMPKKQQSLLKPNLFGIGTSSNIIKIKNVSSTLSNESVVNKYSEKWSQEKRLKDWIAPLHGDEARCKWCDCTITARQVYIHALSMKHVKNAQKFSVTFDPVSCKQEVDVNIMPGRQMADAATSTKRVKSYSQKYVMRWNLDPLLRDWLAPVRGNAYRARCRWCKVDLRAHYKDLKDHGSTMKHILNVKLPEDCDETDSTKDERELIEEDEERFPRKKLKKERDDSSKRKGKESSCYFLSRSWSRYRQKYRKAWEQDPNFRGWIAPVEGDIFKARCRYCRILVRAHRKDLKDHSRTTKHSTNVAYGKPYNGSIHHQPNNKNSHGVVIPKPKMMRRRKILQPKRKRLITGLNTMGTEGLGDSLLRPDDTLTSVENLVNIASFSLGPQSESAVTTLVFPNATQIDQSVVAALPSDTKTLYRVKTLQRNSVDPQIMKTKKEVVDATTDDNVVRDLSRLVKKVTLWEFLKMKVQRGNDGLKIPEMLSEFESLYDQIQRIVKERLEPVDREKESVKVKHHRRSTQKSEDILVLKSDSLAKLLDMSVGHYRIKNQPNEKDSKAKTNDAATKKNGKRSRATTSDVATSSSSSTSFRTMENNNCTNLVVFQTANSDDVLNSSDFVYSSSSSDQIIEMRESECIEPSSGDNDTVLYTDSDGTVVIQVRGTGERQIPIDVIQSLFAGMTRDDLRTLNSGEESNSVAS